MQHRSALGVTRAPRRPFRPWTDNVSADDVAFASPSLKRPAAAPPSPRTLPPPPPPVPLAVLSVAPARAVVSGGKLRVRASVDPALSSDALTVTVGGVVRPNFALKRRGLPPREAEVVLTAPVLRGRRAAVQLHTLGATSAPDGAAVVVVRPPPSPFRPASAPPPPAASPPAAADGLSRWAADAAPAAADEPSSFQPHFVVCKQLDAAALVKKVERILDSDLPFRMAVDAAGGMGVGDLHGLLERIAPKKPPTTSDTQAAFEACAGGRDKVTVANFVATQVRARHENEEARKAAEEAAARETEARRCRETVSSARRLRLAAAARREWERRHEEGDGGHWAHWRGAYPDGELPPSTWSRQSHQVAAFSFNPTLARELREAALLRRDVR